MPTSDVSAGFDTVYPSDGVHYTKVDDGASHDSATTYNRAESNGDKDIFGLEDMSEPSGSYDIDVTIYIVEQDAGTGNAFFDAGVVISSTEYVGINDQQAQNSWTSHDYTWEENPAGGEWTYTAINGMNLFVEVYDVAPDVDVTTFYVIVTITYAATWKPTFTSSPDTTATEDEAYSYEATCNETVTWGAAMTSNATWLTWTQANHTVWGTPGESDIGSFYVNITATSDAGTLEEYQNYTVTVSAGPMEWAPTFTSSPDLTATEGIPYSYEATCNESVTWGVAMTSNATWLTWTQANHTVWGTPAEEDVGSYYVNITATSTAGTLEGYQNYTVTVEAGPDWAPTFTSSPDITADEDVAYSYEASCNETVTWGVSMLSNATWLTWTQANHTVWGTPTETDIGSFYVNITATSDEGHLTAYQNYSVTVSAGPMEWAPTFTSSPDETAVEDEPYSYEATCNETVTWGVSMTSNATWLTWTQGNHTVWGTPDALDIGSYYVNISATSDAGTLEGYQNYTITVSAPANAAPTFTSTPDATSHNNTLYYYDANADDTDEDPLTFDLEGSIEAWATINPSTGVVQGTPTTIGDYWMNISVTDGTATVWQNTSIHIYTDAPSFVSSAITEWQNGTTYTYNAQATDPEAEGLTFGPLEGNGTSFVGITPAGYYCMVQGAITEMGWWYLNLSVSDGTNTVWQNWTLTALNSAPYFTFEAILSGMVNESYVCPVSGNDNNSDDLIYSIDTSSIETLAWLSLNLTTMQLEGVPTINGSYDVNLSVTDTVGAISWYNFTITVDLNDADTVSVLALILALSFCVILLMAGFKERTLWLLGGPCWMICGVLVFMDYGQAFMLMSLGLGMFLMIKGAFDVAG